MKKGVLLIFIALVLSSFAVPSDIWEVLAELQLKTRYNEKTEMFELELISTKEIENLEGKMIEIKGGVIKDEKHGLVLSRYPKSLYSCTGPSSKNIIRIKAKRKIITNSEKHYTLKGRFELNTTGLFETPYILNEVECLDCGKNR